MRASFVFILLGCLVGTANAAGSDLTVAVQNVRSACGGISAELSDMKKMAGINTAVTAVGTVAGGAATVVGVVKASKDKELEENELALDEVMKKAGFIEIKSDDELLSIFGSMYAQTGTEVGEALSGSIEGLRKEIMAKEKQSKNLGNWRTGMMATSTATNIAGTIIASGNRVKGDLKEQINECLVAVKNLSDARMQVRIDGSATDVELSRVENIIRACEEWEMVDVSSINKKASGAAISSGIGAGLGLAGTVTSAMANTDDVRLDNTASGKNKEKTLNTASNILAGGTTVASATATVFNATQISAIKRAVAVADQCEEALR